MLQLDIGLMHCIPWCTLYTLQMYCCSWKNMCSRACAAPLNYNLSLVAAKDLSKRVGLLWKAGSVYKTVYDAVRILYTIISIYRQKGIYLQYLQYIPYIGYPVRNQSWATKKVVSCHYCTHCTVLAVQYTIHKLNSGCQIICRLWLCFFKLLYESMNYYFESST